MKKSSQGLRDLVDQLHPRSPKEVMGEAANSSLLGSTLSAAAATFLLLVGVTVVVYLFRGPEEATKTAATTETSATTTQQPVKAPADQAEQTAAEPPAETSDPETAVEAMGIGETKDADAQPETLENRLDQLLDGLE